MNAPKRICLFAGFSRYKKIDAYVVEFIRHLSKFADVYYCADNDLPADEIQKLSSLTHGVYSGRHQKYDFGSWGRIIEALGWERIEKYDEMLLVNDSCFGPFSPLDHIFDQMNRLDCAAWGIAKNHFLMSFFLCLRRPVINDPAFRSFFKTIPQSSDKVVFIKCEKQLSMILQKHPSATFLDKKDLKFLYNRHRRQIRKALKQSLPFYIRLISPLRLKKIRLYDNQALILPFLGFPFIKKNAFYDQSSIVSVCGLTFIRNNFNYDPQFIRAALAPDFQEKACIKRYLRARIKRIVQQNICHLSAFFSGGRKKKIARP